jgi:hypothetical protein
MCGDRRRGLLKSVELLGTWVPICHNCAALTAKLEPMPQSLGAIREQLLRDRRCVDRRWGKRDSRVFRYDRRGRERRIPRSASEAVDDEMIIEISELVSELELIANETRSDLTCIQQRPESGE